MNIFNKLSELIELKFKKNMKNHLLSFSSPEKWEEEDNVDFVFYDVNEYQKEYTQLVNENLTLKIMIENLLKRLRTILKSTNIKDEITNIMIENEQKMAYYQKHSKGKFEPNLFYSNSSTQTYFFDDVKQNDNQNNNNKLNKNDQNIKNEKEFPKDNQINKKIDELNRTKQNLNYQEGKQQNSNDLLLNKSKENKGKSKTDSDFYYLTSNDIDYDQEIEILRNQLSDQINENDRLRQEIRKQEKQKTTYSISCKRLIHELNKSSITDIIEFDLSGLDTNKSPYEIEKCINHVIKAQRNKNEEIIDRINPNIGLSNPQNFSIHEEDEIIQQKDKYQLIQLCKIVNNTIRTCTEQIKQQHSNILSKYEEKTTI